MTYNFILAAMLLLAPNRDHRELAEHVANTIDADAPLFRGDDAKRKTAALVVAVAYRESSFRNDAKSATNDHCLMQIHGRPELRNDVEACVRVGLAMLRESMRICPSHPIAFYASGPGGCQNGRAQKISRDRMNIAEWLVWQLAKKEEK